nr:TnsA-like heteromeric transposase endonuclease subunit [Streptomyces sp. CB01881]
MVFHRGEERCRARLGGCWDVRFEDVEPVREFTWAKNGQSFAGLYYSVTAGGHVGYESWLERDRLILLDRDREVVAIASQPFWLHWHDGRRERRHAPDYFVRLANGRGRVVDVRAADRLDERTLEAFAATRRACAAAGWEFERAGVPDPVLMENVRWLSRYRRRRNAGPAEVRDRLVDVFADPKPLRAGVELVGDGLLVLPVLFHLMWSGVLAADLDGELLGTHSLVWTEGRRHWVS